MRMVIALALLALSSGEAFSQGNGCGPPSPPPPAPPGCRELVPICVCDAQGRNCHYTLQCIPGF